MTHPLFARLDRQLAFVRREMATVREAGRRFRALQRRAVRKEPGGELYHEWSHAASLADGVAAVYTGLESILEAVANEIDEFVPRGDASDAELVDAMGVALKGVRPALLAEQTRALMHEARRFRHVVRHNYALHLRLPEVAKNVGVGNRLVTAFARDYRRFVALMLAKTVRGTRRYRVRGP